MKSLAPEDLLFGLAVFYRSRRLNIFGLGQAVGAD